MSLPRTTIRVLLLLALTTLAAEAQTPVQPPGQPTEQTPAITAPAPVKKPRPITPKSGYNPNLILLDPGHGGTDTGAKLTGDIFEKDATLAFAGRIKTLLAAKGFTVAFTHDTATDQLTSDQRAEAANRSHAAACILLHLANGGHGVHLFTSALPFSFRSNDPDEVPPIQRWDTAQTGSLAQSTRLATALSDTFYAIRVPLVLGKVSVPPIDSMTCPAVAIELAPLANPDDEDSPTPASDEAYQQRIATAITTALINWRTYLQGQAAAAAMSAASPTAPAKPTPPPVKKPAPPPVKAIPEETPVVPDRAPGAPPQ